MSSFKDYGKRLPSISVPDPSSIPGAIAGLPGAIKKEGDRFIRGIGDRIDGITADIQALPQAATEEIERLKNLGTAKEKIEDELRRVEKLLRRQIRDAGSQVQGATVDFDINKHWKAIITGSGATLILAGIVGLGPVALNQFLDRNLGLHVRVMNWMFVLREIESHLDRPGGGRLPAESRPIQL